MLWIFPAVGIFCTAHQRGHAEIKKAAVTLGEPEMAVTKNSKEKTTAPVERAIEATEGAGRFRIRLIDHKGADI